MIQKADGGKREKICTANELVLEQEIGDLYHHWQTLKIPLKTETGEGVYFGAFRVENFWIDKSPLRRVINVKTNYFSLRWPYRLKEEIECYYKPEPRVEWEEEPCGIFPSLKWLDYSDGKKGLTVIHRGIPENEVRDRRGRLFNSVKKRVNAVLGWYFGSCNTCP